MSIADHSEELARWLQESGRRTWCRSTLRGKELGFAEPPSMPRARTYRTLLLGLLAVAFLEYFYADALLQILTLPYLIVFVLTG